MSDLTKYYTPSPRQRNKIEIAKEAASNAEEELVDFIYGCNVGCTKPHTHEVGLYGQPYEFVLAAYPWGEPGPLERYDGPDNWQAEFLIELGEIIRSNAFDGLHAVDPVQMTRASGHGIGKGVMSAFLVNFLMATRINAIGTVTANSYPQLETKTWATIQKWTKLCFVAHWFEVTGDRMWKPNFREQWFTAALSCAPENAQSFAGQHNAASTSFYIVDEGSEVPDEIYEKADGGLTDGEPMIFVFGNPTQRLGKFYNINFGFEREHWSHKSIDSRTCKFTNKKLLARWEKMWGEDSERFRVQVKGLPPNASDLQFIASNLVSEAQRRKPTVLRNDPVICGLDVSRGGADNCVFRFRRGLDAQSIPAIRISGSDARNSTVLENKALDLLRNGVPIPEQTGEYVPFGITEGYARGERRLPIAQMFIDGTGVGGPVCDHIKTLGFEKQVTEIQFGWEAPNTDGVEQCSNMRSWMWTLMRAFLEKGSIDKSTDLESDLTRPRYKFNNKNQIVLESKEAMKTRCGTIEHSGSPDDGDALALTFARPVAPRKKLHHEAEEEYEGEFDGDSFASLKVTGWG